MYDKLPQIAQIVEDTIDGKKVQKRIYIDGSYSLREGNEITRYFKNGRQLTYRPAKGGFILREEKRPDGTKRDWYENGQMEREILPDGTWYHWHKNGQMSHENLSNGICRMWYENGQLEYEYLPDKTKCWWYENGKKRSDENLQNETYIEYDKDGNVICHETKGEDDTRTYLKLRKRREALREMVADKIDERDNKNPNPEKKSYERVIKNKNLAVIKAVMKAKLTK